MSALTPAHLEQMKDTRHRLLVEVERLHQIPQDSALRYVLLKLEAAIRGLDDTINRNTPDPLSKS